MHWKSGAELRQQLDQNVSIAWQQRGLRDGLSRVSQSFGVAIFLDRRLDPGQLLTLTVRDQSLEMLIKQAAQAAHGETTLVGAVTFVGPPATASKLATLAAIRRQEAAKVLGDAKARLLRSEAWQWEELSEPRALVAELARRASVSVANADAIPHDLWPAASLPALPWTDRLTLLLAGFDLTFQIEDRGGSVRLVPIPETVVLEKRYPSRGTATNLAAQLGRVLPDAKIRVEQSQLVVVGRQEDHEIVERLLAGQSVRSSKVKKAGEKLYSLQVANEPAGNVVRKVADTLGKELRCEPSVLERLKQPVTFKVENVALSKLMEASLEPLGLTYRLTDSELAILEE